MIRRSDGEQGADFARARRGGGRPVGAGGGFDGHWQRVRDELRKQLGNRTFERWIQSVELESADDGRVVLAAPTRFLRDWVAPRYGDRIRALWRLEVASVRTVEFVVRSALAAGNGEARPSPAGAAATAGDGEFGTGLDEKYGFETFVVGKPNEFAHAAALNVSEADDVPFNPLYIHGGVGLGKTHLMHAIGLRARALRPRRRVIYLSAERFMYEFIRALRFESVMGFKERVRSVDLLLIDDVQFIGGKDSTQEEFFHTFNALVTDRKQIVVSGDRLPGDLEYMEERMRSRLGSGLAAEVHATSYELRLGILQARVERMGKESQVPARVLEFLAHKITGSVRELEGALTSLVAHATLRGREITLDSCQDILRDKLRTTGRRVTIDEIQKKVAEYYNIRVSEMSSARRAQVVVRPRHVAMYLAKELTSRSLPEIGRHFGNRDHTTVLHAVRRITGLRQKDAQIAEDVEFLKRMLER